MPFAISSLFLSTYCSITLVLNTWRRRWNTWTNVNVNWFHVRQNCQELLNSFTVFSFIFWNLVVIKLKKTFCIFTSLCFSAPVDSQSCVFDDTFWNHYVPVTTSTLSIFLVMFEIYSLSEQDAGTLSAHTQNKWMTQVLPIFRISFKTLFLSYALKFWNCKRVMVPYVRVFIVWKLVVLLGA